MFSLDPAQQEFMRSVRDTARTELRPLASGGEPGAVNRALVKAMGDLGLLARLFPEAGAGREAACLDLCLLRESLAQVCTEAETALALQGLGTYPILQSGRPAQIKRWVPPVAAGDLIAGFALSEPEAGSDAAALRLRAEPDGQGWRLTGEKMWISNAPEADFYTVFARTGEDAGARGVSAFVVAGDRPGLSGEHVDMLSPHPIGRLVFDGVAVSADDLLGEPGRGFRVAMRTLDLFRPSVGAFAVGMAQAALDAAIEHAGEREAFGAALKELQSVSHTLADMATRTEAARLMVYAAARRYDSGNGADHAPGSSSGSDSGSDNNVGGSAGDSGSVAARSAMAKLLATETAQFVVDAAIQMHGARALRHGHLLEHLYREVRAPRIYEGATEVQRSIIARDLYR